jgi:hypothetical protein
MANRASSTWRRSFNRYVPLGALIIGLILILSSVAVADTGSGLSARVITGTVLVLAGYLYGATPFLTSEREHTALRGEVDSFIDLVRKLNQTAIAIGGGPEFDEVTKAMRESLWRIEELAGKES